MFRSADHEQGWQSYGRNPYSIEIIENSNISRSLRSRDRRFETGLTEKFGRRSEPALLVLA